MGQLQDALDKKLNQKLSEQNFLMLALGRVAKARGITASVEQLEIAAALLADASAKGKTAVSDYEVELGESRIVPTETELEVAMDDVSEEIGTSLGLARFEASEALAKELLPTEYREASETLRFGRLEKRRFERVLYQKWNKPLEKLELIIGIAHEAGEAFLQDVNERDPDDDTQAFQQQNELLDVLVRIHARSCRIAREVKCLLEGGYADGAMARWRSLHECAVTAMFIAQHGYPVARLFVDHAAVERHKAAVIYNEHCAALGFEPFEQSDLDKFKSEYDAAWNRHGKDFKEKYGWASSTLRMARPNFADIEKHLDMNQWRPFYGMACRSVHAGAQSIFFTLSGDIDGENHLVAGATDMGLADPIQCTANSILQVSAATFTVESNLDELVAVGLIKLICEDLASDLADAN